MPSGSLYVSSAKKPEEMMVPREDHDGEFHAKQLVRCQGFVKARRVAWCLRRQYATHAQRWGRVCPIVQWRCGPSNARCRAVAGGRTSAHGHKTLVMADPPISNTMLYSDTNAMDRFHHTEHAEAELR